MDLKKQRRSHQIIASDPTDNYYKNETDSMITIAKQTIAQSVTPLPYKSLKELNG